MASPTSDERLRLLFMDSPLAISILTGAEHRFVLANPRYLEMVRRTAVVGQTMAEAFPEIVGTPLMDIFDRVYRTGEPFFTQEYVTELDREGTGVPQPGHFEFNLAATRDAAGHIDGMMCTAAEITQQVRSRQALEALSSELRESEQRFRLLATAGAHALWRTSALGEALELPGWTELTGQTPEEWRGTGWRQAIHPDERSRVLASLEACASLHQPLHATFRLNRKSPEPWVTLEGVPLPGPDGQITEWVGTLRDVTQAQRAEAALGLLVTLGETLSQSLELPLILDAFAQASVPLFADWAVVDLLDEQGVTRRAAVAHADPTRAHLAQELKAFPPSGHPGHLPSQGLQMDRAHLISDYTDQMAQEGITDPHLLQLRREMGICSVLVVPLVARDRRVGVVTFTTADSRRRFTESDRLLGEDLGRRLASAIENAQLLQTAERERARAEDANRAKDEFLAVVSHELRTPLTSMLGWLQMLRSGSLPVARQVKALETVERNARSQAKLVEDLLDVSQIMIGKLRLEVELLNLASVVEAAVEAVRPAADAKDIRLKMALSTGVSVRGDPNRLQQVVWNLLSNAIKFTPRGGGVSVFLERIHSSVQLTVSDTGQGIPADFLPHVFEQFRQADTGSTRKHGGLGLGLSIVRHLVELHGGAVEAHSPGEAQGSTFLMQLPAAVLRGGTAETPAAPAEGIDAHECPPEIRGLRVLVLEDEQDTRELLVSMLERCGAAVTALASSAEALSWLRTQRVDAIVSDIGLPDEDGHRFIQQVRQLPRERGGQTPAIALTAYSRASDRRRALQAGFNMHVPKPIDAAELLVVLASITAFQR